MKRLAYIVDMRYIWQRQRWANFWWNNQALMVPLGRVRLLQGHLQQRFAQLQLNSDGAAEAALLTEETLRTAAIEGEQLNVLSVRSSVARQLGLPTGGLPAPERHVDGLVSVLLDATRNAAAPLTLRRLKGWHAALFPTGYSGLYKIPTGTWRRDDPMQVVSGPVGRETIHFEAPPAPHVATFIRDFIVWWKTSRRDETLDGIVRAAIAHLYFITMHPFSDGNGRLARALTNMALAQDDGLTYRLYSLSSQIMATRDEYYQVLERTQKGVGDITEWLLWFVQMLGQAMRQSDKIIGWTLVKAHFWARHAQTLLNDRQRKVIIRLLDAGPEGFVGGLTTRKYVALTKASRATAYRELDDLVAKKMLIPSDAAGRSANYRIDAQPIADLTDHSAL